MARNLIYEGCEKKSRAIVSITVYGQKERYELRKGSGKKIRIEMESGQEKPPDGMTVRLRTVGQYRTYLGGDPKLWGVWQPMGGDHLVITPYTFDVVTFSDSTGFSSTHYAVGANGSRNPIFVAYAEYNRSGRLISERQLVGIRAFDPQGNEIDSGFPSGYNNKWKVYLSEETIEGSGDFIGKFALEYTQAPARIGHDCECKEDCLKVHDMNDEEDNICVCTPDNADDY